MSASDAKYERSFRLKTNVWTRKLRLLGRLGEGGHKGKSRGLMKRRLTICRLLFSKKKRLLKMSMACAWQERGINPRRRKLPY